MPSQRVSFQAAAGHNLQGIIDLPNTDDFPGGPRAYGLFSHCFTCTKDLKAIVKISRALAKSGIAILRFDFTGLGESGGDFSESNFDTNRADIQSAVNWMKQEHSGPQLLIGHSLGGAAMIGMAPKIESAQALVTIASPSDTHHLVGVLLKKNPAIGSTGQGEVEIGGRTYLMKQQLLDNLKSHDIHADLQNMRLPHLIFHSREDETLAYWHAEDMLKHSAGAKALITLPGSDHLLVNQKEDVGYVAKMIESWASRYLG